MSANANNEIVISAEEFRAAFPEFSDVTKYPDAMVNSCLTWAGYYVSTSKSGHINIERRTLMIELMAAHILFLRSQTVSATGGTASSSGGGSTVSGQVVSATIGDVSVSVVAPKNADELSYWLNQTPYGQQFLALLRMLMTPMLWCGSLQRVLNNGRGRR